MALVAALPPWLPLEPASDAVDQLQTGQRNPIVYGDHPNTSPDTDSDSDVLPVVQNEPTNMELIPVGPPKYSLSTFMDARSFRCIQIFMMETQRFTIIRPIPVATNYQLFYQEPAFRNLMNAFITLAHADYEPPVPDSKEFVYSSLLAAIRRMRLESNEIDDEAHIKCRALLAMIEATRTHGGNDFMPITQAVMGLFNAWDAEMDEVIPTVAQRREKLMVQYRAILKASQSLFSAVKTIQPAAPLPCQRTKPNFQRNYIDFICGVELTSFISESYGFSISEPTNKAALEKKLKAWYKAFEIATAQPELLSLQEVLEARMLLVHYLRCSIVLDACTSSTETRYARHNTDFAGILDCMDRVLETDYWQAELMWLGVVVPLFFTAVHCRLRTHRHRALAMLRNNNIDERSWNSRVAYLIASAVAAVESNDSRSSEDEDAAFVRLLSADFKASTETLTIDYIDVRTQTKKTYEMLVLGAEDLGVCRRLTIWPVTVEVRTHGAAFSRCPLGGPLDMLGDYSENDYLKWLKAALRSRPLILPSAAT